MSNLKPFDLEAAKSGAPIVTRDGRKVKFIAHVPEAAIHCRVITLEGTIIRTHWESGRYYSDGEGILDLFMAPKKRAVWVNLCPRCGGTGQIEESRLRKAELSEVSAARTDEGALP